MTVDSIGDVDCIDIGVDDDDTSNEKNNKDANDENTVGNGTTIIKSRSSAQDVNVGNEHVKKVEVYYCELCRYYLPMKEEYEIALRKHCATRSHLRSYLRFKENQNLRAAAEKIHRRHQEQREAKKEKES